METTIMEKQMEKKMENEMETGFIVLLSQKQGEGATTTRAHTQKQGRHPRIGVIGRLMTETGPSDEEGLWGCPGL